MGIVVYSKPNCSFCVKAKSLLSSRNKAYEEVVVGEDLLREDFISLFPEQKTLPLILVDGQQIGGFSNLVEYLDNNSAQFLTG